MNKKVSNKIVYLNFILAFLILNLHSAYMELFDTNNTVLVINQFVRIVCNMAVPTFFFVSAMLFYRSCKRKRYKEVKSNFWNLNSIETCMCFTRFYIKGEHHANRY